MLLVFVNKERNEVLYATYDEDSAKQFYKYKKIKLAERYFDDVEIWEVVDYDD